MSNSAGYWEQLRTALSERLSEQAFGTWISRMTCIRDEPGILVLGFPDSFGLDWVNNHYRGLFEEQLHAIDPQAKLSLVIHEGVDPQPAASSNVSNPSPSSGPAGPIAPKPRVVGDPMYRGPRRPNGANGLSSADNIAPAPLNDRYTFETFVTGPSNQLAAAAAQRVSDNPGYAYNPLFVFGPVGLGKTHLIQAIGNRVKATTAGARVMYQTTEQFVNDVIQGIRFERMDEIRSAYRACDVLIIDDIQFIAGKEACQAEFFHTFNALYDARKQVVVTSDKLPHEMKDLEERVKTRFQWGLVVDLQPPELETRVAIVKKKADNDAIPLDDEVAMFIAQSVRSNVRELEGCLIRVSAYASLANQPITLDLAKNVLRDIVPIRGKLTCETIVKRTADYFEVKISDLKSKKRGRAIAFPRQVAMYLCRKHTEASYPEIGHALGGKDHTTALNAFNRIGERSAEPEVARAVHDLEKLLLE